MAGSKLKIQTKIMASTILEVIVAMIMIIIVFGIAMMIYTNVVRSSLSVKKLKAQAILQEVLQKAEQSKGNSNQSVTIDEFRIEQEIKSYNNETQLTDIHLAAYDSNQQKIAELEKVIINND